MSNYGSELGGQSPCNPKSLNFLLLLDITSAKRSISLVRLLITDHILRKKSLIAFRQILVKILPAACIFSYTIMTYLKKLHGTNSLNTKQCPVGLSTRIIPQVSPFLPKFPLLCWCFVAPARCGLSPFPLNLYGKPWRWGEIITQEPKIY